MLKRSPTPSRRPLSQFSFLFSPSHLAGRKRTKRNYSFRVFSGLESLVSQLVSEGMEMSEALNYALAFALDVAEEAAPYGPLFSFEAGRRGQTVARTMAQLAVEALVSKYPDLSAEMQRSVTPKRK
jgi:hypothetical protein